MEEVYDIVESAIDSAFTDQKFLLKFYEYLKDRDTKRYGDKETDGDRTILMKTYDTIFRKHFVMGILIGWRNFPEGADGVISFSALP